MLKRLAQTFRCARHIPPQQLWRRLSLSLKRQVLMRTGKFLPRNQLPLPLEELELPLFRKDDHLAFEHEDRWWAYQLHCAIALAAPVAWLAPQAIPLDAYDATGFATVQSQSRPATHLERLTLHYHEFLESLPCKLAQEVILSWIEHNPPYQRGYWLDSWNSYGLSIRCVEWLHWLALGERRQDLEAEFLNTMTGSLCEQIRFLVANLETDICGNHLIKNIRCLLWAGASFSGPEADQWTELGWELLNQELDRQFLSDGMHYELSPAYHCQVLADLLECASVVEPEKREALIQRLQPSFDAMQVLTHPDGRISLFSDGGLHMAHSPDEIQTAWQALTSSPLDRGKTVHRLDASGYFQFSNPRQWLLVDCGPVCEDTLPAHGHGDMLAFEWDVAGQRFFVDCGVYHYQGDTRYRDRSAHSHNTLAIAGRDQAEFVGSFRTGHRAQAHLDELRVEEGEFYLSGSHQAYSDHASQITHRREYRACDNRLEIRDSIESSRQQQDYCVRFLLHDACQIEQTSEREVLLRRDDHRVRFNADRPVQIEPAHWSPDFGQRIPTHRIQVAGDTIPAEMHFKLTVEN